MDKPDLLARFENAARKLRPTATAVALGAALVASTSPVVAAEGAARFDAADVEAQVEITTLTSAEALERALAADPDSISDQLETLRFDQNPDILPNAGEAEAIVWNQTANWIVAVNGDGEPVYLPREGFDRLEAVTMGSLAERYQHFEGLKEQLPGASLGEKVKNDETLLVLGNYYDRDLRDDLATVIRHELFGVPAAGYEESLEEVNEHFGRDEPGFFGRAAEEAAEEVEREAEHQVDRAIYDAVDILMGRGR